MLVIYCTLKVKILLDDTHMQKLEQCFDAMIFGTEMDYGDASRLFMKSLRQGWQIHDRLFRENMLQTSSGYMHTCMFTPSGRKLSYLCSQLRAQQS